MNNSIHSNITNAFSKNVRVLVMGISILWVIFHHIDSNYRHSGQVPPLFVAIFNLGYIGVDLFFLLSSFGLAASLNKNNIKQYYLNRLKRIYPNCILFLLLLFLLFSPCNLSTCFYESLLQLTGLSLYKMSNTFSTGFCFDWYSPAILTIYLLFPIFNKLIEYIYKKGLLSILAVMFFLTLISIVMYRVCHTPFLYLGYRIPILFMGGLFYYLIRDKKFKDLIVLLCFTTIISQFVYYERLSYSLLSPILLFSLSTLSEYFRPALIRKTLQFTGKYSYELYLSHILIIAIYLPKSDYTNIYLWIVVTIIGTSLILIPFYVLNNYLIRR